MIDNEEEAVDENEFDFTLDDGEELNFNDPVPAFGDEAIIDLYEEEDSEIEKIILEEVKMLDLPDAVDKVIAKLNSTQKCK